MRRALWPITESDRFLEALRCGSAAERRFFAGGPGAVRPGGAQHGPSVTSGQANRDRFRRLLWSPPSFARCRWPTECAWAGTSPFRPAGIESLRAAVLRLLTERRAGDHRVLPVLLAGGARPSRVSRDRSARM